MKLVLIIIVAGLIPLLIYSITRVFRPVPVDELHRYVNQSRKVEILVSKTLPTSKGVLLYPASAESFYILIPTSALSKFPKNSELYYAGKRLRVVAIINQDDSGYYMRLESKQQIEEVK